MLLLVAVVAALAGWFWADLIDRHGRLPSVPWLAVLVVWVVAGFVGVWALVARRRLNPKPGAPRMAPLAAARTTALALAGSRTGAVVFGLYGGIALRLLQETTVAAGREKETHRVSPDRVGTVPLDRWCHSQPRPAPAPVGAEAPADGAAGAGRWLWATGRDRGIGLRMAGSLAPATPP